MLSYRESRNKFLNVIFYHAYSYLVISKGNSYAIYYVFSYFCCCIVAAVVAAMFIVAVGLVVGCIMIYGNRFKLRLRVSYHQILIDYSVIDRSVTITYANR